MATRRLEPLAWLLFSAGGVLAALVLPVLVFLFGLAFPLGWLPAPSYAHLLALVQPVAGASWRSGSSRSCRCCTGRTASATPCTTACR